MSAIAIVIVTYNSGVEIGPCIAAAHLIPDAEIVVVDNASCDGSAGQASAAGARVVANPSNRGFAAAVNTGVEVTSAPLILLLNPDAEYQSGIEHLVHCFRDPRVAGAGGLMVGADQRPQAGFMARNLPTSLTLAFEVLGLNRMFPGNPVNRRYRCRGLDLQNPSVVQQPAAAFFMFRREAWESVGGWDPGFWPIWFEDVDFCARLRSAGRAVMFHPLAVAKHTGGHSIHSLPLKVREQYWYGSLLRYSSRRFTAAGYFGVRWAVVAGALVRAITGLWKHGSKAVPVYWAVIRLAIRGVPESGSGGEGFRRAG